MRRRGRIPAESSSSGVRGPRLLYVRDTCNTHRLSSAIGGKLTDAPTAGTNPAEFGAPDEMKSFQFEAALRLMILCAGSPVGKPETLAPPFFNGDVACILLACFEGALCPDCAPPRSESKEDVAEPAAIPKPEVFFWRSRAFSFASSKLFLMASVLMCCGPHSRSATATAWA